MEKIKELLNNLEAIFKQKYELDALTKFTESIINDLPIEISIPTLKLSSTEEEKTTSEKIDIILLELHNFLQLYKRNKQ
ncbi:MAG: hypothetical protein ACTSRG_15270 [Candidatus Helarchaeota archaeon]